MSLVYCINFYLFLSIVFSFGVLLCEICIRKQLEPNRRDEQVAMVKNLTLRALIRRCLERAPEARTSIEDIRNNQY